MPLIQTVHPNRIVVHASKQGEYSAEIEALVQGFKNSAKEPKSNFLRLSNIVKIATFNVRIWTQLNTYPNSQHMQSCLI